MDTSDTKSHVMNAEYSTLELKNPNDENVSMQLKHKHKMKRPHSATSRTNENQLSLNTSNHTYESTKSGATNSLKTTNKSKQNPSKCKNTNEFLHHLLTSKIAQLEVGGDENLDTPVDISGIYSNETLPSSLVSTADEILVNEIYTWEEKTQKLYSELIQPSSTNIRTLQRKISELHSKYILLKQRQEDFLQDYQKLQLSKSKLENLCRELQKQNKSIANESRRIADEEDIKRKQLSQQFQQTIDEVSQKMEQQGTQYIASLRENETLQNKLHEFLNQYTLREQHFQKQFEAKDLALQLCETKLDHQMKLTLQEAERSKLAIDKAQALAERETVLHSQLNTYAEKFDVVQDTLTKSNEMFTSFRQEMDRMAKQTKKLEKENQALKEKCAAYDYGAIQKLQDNANAQEEKMKLQEKIKKLENLCRVLQAERKARTQLSDLIEIDPNYIQYKYVYDNVSLGFPIIEFSDTLDQPSEVVEHISSNANCASTYPKRLIVKKQIGCKTAPITYTFQEKVFTSKDIPPEKALIKAQVLKSVERNILQTEIPKWNASTSNYDNMAMTGKCYTRTNVHSERTHSNTYVYNYRAEKLPCKYPSVKPKLNRFNMGILDIALANENMGESFNNDKRLLQGHCKRTEELPNHPDLVDAVPWNASTAMTHNERQKHFLELERNRLLTNEKWNKKLRGNYKSPEKLAREAEEDIRKQKLDIRKEFITSN